MRAKMVEIRWHWHDEKKCPTPVFSVDMAPYDESSYRLATAGGDTTVKLWRVSHAAEGEGTQVDFLAELSRHTAAVNCVRFSPDGTKLASGGDDNIIMIWTLEEMLKMGPAGTAPAETLDEIGSVEKWRIATVLRRHSEDVYDLAWSPDSTQLISGSVDKTCVIWDTNTGNPIDHLRHHQHFVQGVAWHPENKCIATQSCDRTCSIIALEPKAGLKTPMFTSGKTLSKNVRRSNQKYRSENDDSDCTKLTEPLYADEAKTSFFRRLTFSPDGALLITPAGRYTNKAGEEVDTMFIYKTSSPASPVVRLSGLPSTVVAVRCCPVLFEPRVDLDAPADGPFDGLPHRTIFAVATATMVLLYDTQQLTPFGGLANLHYAAISDVAWSADGRVLVISSEDGYCSIVTFTEADLGKAIPMAKAPRPARAPVAPAKATITSMFKATPATKLAIASMDVEPASTVETVASSSRPSEEASGGAGKQRRITPTLVTPVSKATAATSEPRRITPTLVAQPASASATAAAPSSEPRRITPTLVTRTVAPAAAAASSEPRRITPTLVTPESTGATRRVVPQLVSVDDASRPTAKRTHENVTPADTTEVKPRRIAPTLIVPGLVE